MKKLLHATALPDYQVKLCFEGGTHGVLDLKPYLDFGIFSRLKDPAAFQQIRVAFNTIEWACGADLDPEWIRDKVRMHAVVST